MLKLFAGLQWVLFGWIFAVWEIYDRSDRGRWAVIIVGGLVLVGATTMLGLWLHHMFPNERPDPFYPYRFPHP